MRRTLADLLVSHDISTSRPLRPIRKPFVLLVVLALICFAPSLGHGQAFVNGSISGAMTDDTGAAIPEATMKLTNLGTSASRTVLTDPTGFYQFLNLAPGDYRIEADKAGFRHFIRQPITVAVNSGIRIDIAMQVGEVTQEVTVTEATPLLEPNSSSLGQVVTSRATKELPLNGRNPLALVALVPGAVMQEGGGSSPVGRNPFLPGNFQIGGGFSQESSSYWDGAPLNTGYAHNLAIVPTQDALRELKVQTNNLSAEYGRFNGGLVNLTTDSGTNKLHGSAYEFIRNKVLNANNFFNNRARVPVPPYTQNQFGVTVGGPLVLPGVYNGKYKTFFFASYGGYRQRLGNAFLLSVPDAAERQGDFSNLRSANGALIPLYDPLTTRRDPNNPSQFIRDPISCNGVLNVICPNRIDPAAGKLVNLWALPNVPGAPANLNNWAGNASSGGNQDQITVRADHNVSEKQRIFVRYTYDNFNSLALDIFGTGGMTSATPAGGQPEDFQNQQFVLSDSYSFSPNTLADVNFSVLRQKYDRTPVSLGYDLGTLSPGWGALNNQVNFRTLPSVGVAGITSFIPNTGSVIQEAGTIFDVSPSLSTIKGRHTLKFGGELMVSRFNYIQLAGASGVFNFNQTFTALSPTNPVGGFGFASFLLGYAASGSLASVVPSAQQQIYPAIYVTDTFNATRKLTFTLGLRWERTGPWSERFDRMTAFDVNLASPVAQPTGLPIKGAFALVNSPERPIRNNVDPPDKQFSPRVGFAYQLTPKTVLRGGYGIFWLPNDVTLGSSTHLDPVNNFSNAFVASIDGGVTPFNTLSSPFPTGLIPPPQRNPSFQNLLLGQGPTAIRAPNAPFAYAQQFNFNVQHELPNDILFDVAYAGAKGTHLTTGINLDQLAPQHMSLGSALLATVPNPFAGLISSGPLSNPTTTAGQLLRPFPQYTGLSWPLANLGDSQYSSLQLKVRKNFSGGQTLLLAYAFSKNITNVEGTGVILDSGGSGGTQNGYNLSAERSVASFDVPQRLVVSYVLDLPFGAGKKFLGSSSGAIGKLVSGWGVNGIMTYQRGFPLHLVTAANLTNSFGGGSRPNFDATACPNGAVLDGSAQSRLNKWFNTACFTQPPAFTFGNLARTLADVRADGIANWDFALFKSTTFGTADNPLALQFRAEFFNLFNTPQFAFPGQTHGTGQFGVVSAQLNNPRLVQFALKFTF